MMRLVFGKYRLRFFLVAFAAWCVLADFGATLCAGADLFPANLTKNQWLTFAAAGFSQPVSGVIYDAGAAPVSGVPLGGLATGCLDIEAAGVYGFNSIFDQYPRRPQLLSPFLGLAVGGQTYVLTTQKFLTGGALQSNCEPRAEIVPADWVITRPAIQGCQPARKIEYWGHYPVADIRYQTAASISVALRAWSPFLPGDWRNSNIPAAVFEVNLQNVSTTVQNGTIALSFPGPTNAATWPTPKKKDELAGNGAPGLAGAVASGGPEVADTQFIRQEVTDNLNNLKGVFVTAPSKNIQYALVVLDEATVRTGTDLSVGGTAWRDIATALPQAQCQIQNGKSFCNEQGASLAVNFQLQPQESRVVRFVLAWYSPSWGTSPQKFTNHYTLHFANALKAAEYLAKNHSSFLQRIIAWQQVIYGTNELPDWLKDSLINILHLYTETGYWAAPNSPVDWSSPHGVYAQNESPRGCPQMECVPCTWYGTLPLVMFFPEVAYTNALGHLHYQWNTTDWQNGAPRFVWGPYGDDIASPGSHHAQHVTNGFSFCDVLYRVWERNGNPQMLQQFYGPVKKATQWTMSLNTSVDKVISMPNISQVNPPTGGSYEWWESTLWYGMSPHAGGLHLAQVEIAKKMAQAMGDTAFEAQCDQWLLSGRTSMEKVWNTTTNNSYYQYYQPAANALDGIERKSDLIHANQFDAELVQHLHGLPAIFPSTRRSTALAKIKTSCLTSTIGAVSFASSTGTPYLTGHVIFPPEIMMLGATYIYEGDSTTGLKVIKDLMTDLTLTKKYTWDQPNMLMGDTGVRTVGSDYYQNTILWAALPAVLGKTLPQLYQPGEIVGRIISAAQGQ